MKATVEFIFEVDRNQPTDKIHKCIERQIFTDLNAYWQNDDDTAQMETMSLIDIKKSLK